MKICPYELLRIFNAGMAKWVGRAKINTERSHYLIWSPPDRALFVLIQDVVSGTVITALTVEMYQKFNPEDLADEHIRFVMNGMVAAGFAPADYWIPTSALVPHVVNVQLFDQLQLVYLGTFSCSVESFGIEKLGLRKDFWRFVAVQLHAKGHDLDRVVTVWAKPPRGDAVEVLHPESLAARAAEAA